MELGFKADASDEDVRLFELHLRRHTYALAELLGGGLCWYYFQGLKVIVQQFKDTRWLVGNSQQTVEHTMQTVRQTVRHTVHGAVGAPKKGMDRAADLAAKRAKAPSEPMALFRNLLFHSMSAVRTFSTKAPEVERMTFMGAWSLLCEKVNTGRTMVWSTLNAQWRYCRAMIHIYGKLRAHHRIHQDGGCAHLHLLVPPTPDTSSTPPPYVSNTVVAPLCAGQEDHYARLIKEHERYWENVCLPNGKWATRADTSKRAKLARHRRYVKRGGNKVYREKYFDSPEEYEGISEEEEGASSERSDMSDGE
jgi:hypothetical protein